MSFGSLDGKGVWEREDAFICMGESLCCSSETIIALFISYSLIKNKKLFSFLSGPVNKKGQRVPW